MTTILKPGEFMLTCRIPEDDLPILERIRQAYGLKSRSEAIRRAYRQVATERALSDAGNGQEATHEG